VTRAGAEAHNKTDKPHMYRSDSMIRGRFERAEELARETAVMARDALMARDAVSERPTAP
jgi:hypothetical protein